MRASIDYYVNWLYIEKLYNDIQVYLLRLLDTFDCAALAKGRRHRPAECCTSDSDI